MPPPPRFKQGDSVLWIQSRELGGGEVAAPPERDDGEYWYRVRFRNRVETMVEAHLEPLSGPDQTLDEIAKAGRWGNIEAFRQAVAVERFRQRKDDRSTIYSFRNQKILFAPHQYKPLLKLLDSPDRKLLIADEVGLGKTIEAGLILAELRARLGINRVLIVCPSRLREKWRLELLRKFGFEFDIFARKDLEGWLEKHREDQRPRPLHAIISHQSMRPEDLRERFLAESPALDLVIVDEAHHARNAGTLTSKLIHGLGGITDTMLLLTATPIQLGNQDLFTLLQALRPSDYKDLKVFHDSLQRHIGVRRAVQLLHQRNADALPEVARSLRSTFETPGGSIADAMAKHLLDELEHHPPATLREWLDLEHSTEELHLLAPILTRTRKRDVQEHAPPRRAVTHICTWSELERRAYCGLLGIDDDSEWPSVGMHLGLIQRSRQAASCLPAALENANGDDSLENLDDQLDMDEEELEGLPPGTAPRSLDIRIQGDAKLAKLKEILRAIDREEPGAKVLLFTYFVGTSHYLARELQKAGWSTARIAGDVPSDPRNPERDERGKVVDRFREDQSLRVLVSTEVGSEGLDFQFCHIVVNYDLPWNPMVVEQRIGRIDRFGQKSTFLGIHNLVVAGTVEERVLLRLYDRVKIFEQSLGDLEHLLGQQMSQLRSEYFNGSLTSSEAERRVTEVATAIENHRKNVAILEQRQGDLIGHEDYIRDELQRVQRLGRHMGGTSLLCVLEGYLQRMHGSAVVRRLDGGRLELDVDDRLCRLVAQTVGHEASAEMQRMRRRGSVRISFDGQEAFEQEASGMVLLNPDHALIRTALAGMEELLEDVNARVSCASATVIDELQELAGGFAYIALFRLTVCSARGRTKLIAVGWSTQTGRLLPDEDAERLLHLVVSEGAKPDSHTLPPPMPAETWECMLRDARRQSRQLEAKEARENSARLQRQREQIDAETQRKLSDIDQKIATAQANLRPARILDMFEAQRRRADDQRQQRHQMLDGARLVSVSLSDPLAICAVRVSKGGVRN